ncbi:MAG TPA: putative toxin-antitoxin system toxin component, PIN family [Thiolinea sp.]|nr:putative toxin-antitoxin system toxin component, PIN family [Thiolinea sp.]
MRVVVDTNILLSGLMKPDGAPGRIVNAWRKHQFELVLSRFQLDEIGRTLAYRRIQQRLCWGEEQTARFLQQLFLRSVWLGGIEAVVTVPADANDNLILSAYLLGQAECLVTGDKGLLALRGQYAIVTAAEFVERHGL